MKILFFIPNNNWPHRFVFKECTAEDRRSKFRKICFYGILHYLKYSNLRSAHYLLFLRLLIFFPNHWIHYIYCKLGSFHKLGSHIFKPLISTYHSVSIVTQIDNLRSSCLSFTKKCVHNFNHTAKVVFASLRLIRRWANTNSTIHPPSSISHMLTFILEQKTPVNSQYW